MGLLHQYVKNKKIIWKLENERGTKEFWYKKTGKLFT